MSFQLMLQISDDGSTNVEFDGDVNHMVLVGVLENIKHSVLRTVEMQSMAAEAAIETQESDEDSEQEDVEGGE